MIRQWMFYVLALDVLEHQVLNSKRKIMKHQEKNYATSTVLRKACLTREYLYIYIQNSKAKFISYQTIFFFKLKKIECFLKNKTKRCCLACFASPLHVRARDTYRVSRARVTCHYWTFARSSPKVIRITCHYWTFAHCALWATPKVIRDGIGVA